MDTLNLITEFVHADRSSPLFSGIAHIDNNVIIIYLKVAMPIKMIVTGGHNLYIIIRQSPINVWDAAAATARIAAG